MSFIKRCSLLEDPFALLSSSLDLTKDSIKSVGPNVEIISVAWNLVAVYCGCMIN